MDMRSQLIAPVASQEVVGKVSVSLDDKLLAEKPLHALAAVAEGGILRRVSDTVLLWFE